MKPNVRMCAIIALTLPFFFCGLAWADKADLIWSTFLGASRVDVGYSIAVDASGCAYVTGTTNSADFPATAGAFDETYNVNVDLHSDVFVAKLNPAGSDLVYSTFLGTVDVDGGNGIAVDSAGNAYVTGWTWASGSSTFPITSGAFDTTHNGHDDVFVTKLNPTGSALLYSTFLGGSWIENGLDIAVDGSGSAYVTGYTASSDFPATAGAFDETYNVDVDLHKDVFVTKLNPAGSALVYSTFLGTVDVDGGNGIAVDGAGNAYVTGWTWASGASTFPTTLGAFDTTHNGHDDVFVTKLNPTGSALLYGTFLGGSWIENGLDIAVDGSGSAYVTGYTASSDFPATPGAFDETYNVAVDQHKDVFVAKLNPAGSALVYSTFLGTVDVDGGNGIAVDSAGNAYVTGWTWASGSSTFPTTLGAFDTTHNGHDDVFVTKLNPTGSALIYGTFLGGSWIENGLDIAVDGSGSAYVTGYTASSDFPTTAGAFDGTHNGDKDLFVAKLNLEGYPVPIVLASFVAAGGQDCIILDWVTASEINCHMWEIYRCERADGEYVRVGNLTGRGSTEKEQTYRWVDRGVIVGVPYFYKLRQVDFEGSSTWSSVVSATASSAMPKTYVLRQNYPNPFNANTEIRYQIPEDGHVVLIIFNTLGQEVRTLVDVEQESGGYSVLWDGRDDLGHVVSSGLYFCRLKVGEFSKTIKMVLAK